MAHVLVLDEKKTNFSCPKKYECCKQSELVTHTNTMQYTCSAASKRVERDVAKMIQVGIINIATIPFDKSLKASLTQISKLHCIHCGQKFLG